MMMIMKRILQYLCIFVANEGARAGSLHFDRRHHHQGSRGPTSSNRAPWYFSALSEATGGQKYEDQSVIIEIPYTSSWMGEDISPSPVPLQQFHPVLPSSFPTFSATHYGEPCPKRPRNWRTLFGRSRCKKKCKSVKSCGSNFQSKSCLCDADCGMSCVKRNLNCPPLMAIKNGYLTYTANFPFDSVVSYTCEENYILVGNSERRCQGNGQWSGNEPTCATSAKCGPPPEIPFAQHSSYNTRQFEQGAMVSYHCVNGYYLSSAHGLTKAKCLPVNGTAVWYGPEMICSPISCGHPGDPVNGDRIGDSFQYPNTVRYKCHDGFDAHGTLTRRCLPNGRWSGEAPTCQPVQCPNPDGPLHGQVLGISLDFRASITYTCEEGHRLVGQQKRVCLADRTWSGQAPRCEEIHCDPPPAPKNGYLEGTDTAFGAEVLYRCLDDILPKGAERAKCQRDGTWSMPPPLCLANCKIPHIEHGQSDFGPVGRTVHHGLQLRIECERGFEPDSAPTSECNNGRWYPTPPRCVPVRCSDWPTSYANAIVLFARSDYNSIARYVCKSGYKMTSSDGIFRCLNGNWTGNDVSCEEVTCKNPRKVEEIRDFNGTIKLEGSMGTYEYHDHFQEVGENRQIQFECPKGFMLIGGPNRATCLNGTWMPRFVPVCLPQDHPQIEDRMDWSNLRNKRSILDQSRSAESGSTSAEHKFRHYSMSTRKKRIRRAGVESSQYVVLSVKPPKRKRRRNHKNKTNLQLDTDYDRSNTYIYGSTCPPIRENERQKYAVIQLAPLPDRRFLSGSEVMIRCESGYELSNPNQNIATCKSGSWVPSVPLCSPKNCNLPVRSNAFFTWRGEIVGGGHEVGHREGAKLFCLRGYELRGDDALECNLGSWLKPAGECVPQSCSIPTLRHGRYKDLFRTSIEHASKIDFQCDHGFYPNPAQGEVHCSYGTLRPHDPECNEDPSIQKTVYLSIGCTRPYNIDNAWVYIKEPTTKRRLLIDPQLSVFPNSTIVHYKCSESMDEHNILRRIRRASHMSTLYTADEAHAIECADGEWVGLLVECAPSGRLPPGVESNSTRLLNLQLFGANKLPCMRPNMSDTPGIVFETNEWLFPHGFKLRVHCARDDTRSWYVRCRRGNWKGFEENSCAPVEHQPQTTTLPAQTCDFNPSFFKNMVIFYEQRKEPIVFKEQLPEGAQLTVRCQHVGLHQFTGTKRLTCRGGTWQGSMPRCRSLGVPWKEGQSPSIAYRATEGNLSLTNDGDLVLRKSSTLELDCLVPRQKSQPYWDYSNSYRKYPQQWARFVLEPWETGYPEESNHSMQLDAFRLTIFMARPEDSGIFHCIMPSGLRHSVRVRVADVNCPNYERLLKRKPTNPTTTSQPPLSVVPGVQASKGSAFGSVLHFTCPVGYKINGALRAYCLENGEWSHSPPTCEMVRCPTISTSHPALTVDSTSTFYDSVATFTCAAGFQIDGPRFVHCNESGEWNDQIPSCRVAACLPPDLPSGARIVSPRDNYTYGDVIRFMCEPGFMQTGRDFAVCNQYGLWSNPAPECQRICLFPGLPENGDTTSDARRTYFVGQIIVYYCKSKYELNGRPDIECLASGQWSNDIPKCLGR